MARTKVSDADLHQYLERGHSQADAARHFGVSEPAIHQRLKRLRGLTSRVVALEKAGEVVEQKLTAAERLQRVQDVILDQLAWAEQQATQAGADRAALADVLVRLSGELGLIRFRGHLSKGGYDVQDGIKAGGETGAPTVQ